MARLELAPYPNPLSLNFYRVNRQTYAHGAKTVSDNGRDEANIIPKDAEEVAGFITS